MLKIFIFIYIIVSNFGKVVNMISIVGLDVGNITTVCVSDDKNVVIESRLKE